MKGANKREVQSIYTKVNKHIKKGGESWDWSNWVWTIDYGLFWLYIYIYEQFSLFDNTNVSHWFHDFLKKYFFIQKSSFLINNLFGNVFQTLSVTGLITLPEVDLGGGAGGARATLPPPPPHPYFLQSHTFSKTCLTCLTPNHLLIDRQLLYFSNTTSITL